MAKWIVSVIAEYEPIELEAETEEEAVEVAHGEVVGTDPMYLDIQAVRCAER